MTILRFLRRRYPSFFEFAMIFFRLGPRGYLDYFRNAKLGWHATELIDESRVSDTSSISDGTPYVELCKLAVLDDSVFNKFKSSYEYRGILEHCDFSQGRQYLKLIKSNPEIMRNLQEITTHDNGNPFTFHYKQFGKISPTQIRYAKVLQDLEILFGNLGEKKLAEIGVGYGGQAIHILNRWPVQKYYVYDLEWPSKLMIKNLSRTKVSLKTQPEIKSWNDKVEVDLVISNYAFSELFRDVQENYLRNVVQSSKAGYMIYNHIHENDSESIGAEEFASRIPGAIILKENPLSFPGNVLVVWGHNKDSDLSSFA